MEEITSFTIDHIKLKKGVYVSRKDHLDKETLTTFDLRMTDPNDEPVMGTAAMHAFEHLGATFLRNSQAQDDVIYFGPMGCRTGFYLILKGDLESKDILELLEEMLDFIVSYDEEIPGASAKGCGNYLDMNLEMAKYHARIYKNILKDITQDRLVYP